MSVKVFCDVCRNEIAGENVGRGGWRVESGKIVIRATVYKDSEEDGADLCLNCLLRILNKKPKRKYERKQKVEPLRETPVFPPEA